MTEIQLKLEIPETPKMKLIRFLLPVPCFLGLDGEIYGSFWFEDIANLPAKIADLLIRRGRCEEVKPHE